MKIGLNLDNRGPGATPENMIRFAVTADRLGFSSLAFSDHIIQFFPPDRMQKQDVPPHQTGYCVPQLAPPVWRELAVRSTRACTHRL
jgi:hypothetical protein